MSKTITKLTLKGIVLFYNINRIA